MEQLPQTQQPILSETDMDALMSGLGFEDDEIIEVNSGDHTPDNELVLESAVEQIEAEEAQKAAEPEEVKPAPAKTKGRKKAEKPEGDAEATPKKSRKHYANKVARVSDTLGAELGNYTILTLSDAALEGAELAAKQQETLEIMGKAGVKVQNRMTLLLEFVAGKSGRLNEVIERTVRLLAKEGSIRTGDKGNLHQNLLAKPYSPAAARAMGNNTIAALRGFSVIVKGSDGSYTVNPESLIWMKLQGLLGL